MSDAPQTSPAADVPLGFTLPERHGRGRLVRIGPVLDTILSAHDYPPVIEALLAEALVLTALLGTTVKAEGGQMTLQAQTTAGPVSLLVCDYRDGELRGYCQYGADAVSLIPQHPSLFALFGQGYLAITFDQAVSGERYQGIVPLEGDSLCHAAEYFFDQSEQIPSIVRAAYRRHDDGRHIAGGLLLQHLPEGEADGPRLAAHDARPDWEHLVALASTIKPDELCDPDLGLDQLVWRLFHEDVVRVWEGDRLHRGCRCDVAHIARVIAQFPENERAEMAGPDGAIIVDCAFCSRAIPLTPADLSAATAAPD